MRELGKWFQNIQPIKAALGLLLMAVATSFSLGAATSRVGNIPRRVGDLEEWREATDSALVQLNANSERIYCVVRLMAENDGPINPLDCR